MQATCSLMSKSGQFRNKKDYLSSAWLEFKEQARLRGGGLCEFCGLPLTEESHLHHRWYPRYFADTLKNLMIVHSHCHKAIHFGSKVMARKNSLAAKGDTGKGNSLSWKQYCSRQRLKNGMA